MQKSLFTCWRKPLDGKEDSLAHPIPEGKISEVDKEITLQWSRLPRFRKRRAGTCDEILHEDLITETFSTKSHSTKVE